MRELLYGRIDAAQAKENRDNAIGNLMLILSIVVMVFMVVFNVGGKSGQVSEVRARELRVSDARLRLDNSEGKRSHRLAREMDNRF